MFGGQVQQAGCLRGCFYQGFSTERNLFFSLVFRDEKINQVMILAKKGTQKDYRSVPCPLHRSLDIPHLYDVKDPKQTFSLKSSVRDYHTSHLVLLA